MSAAGYRPHDPAGEAVRCRADGEAEDRADADVLRASEPVRPGDAEHG